MEAFLEVLVDYNQAIWPGQLTAFFFCALLLGLLLWPRTGSDRVIAGFLALGWLWSGLVFMDLYQIRLNWAARYFGVVFGIQGLLLIWSGTIKDRLRFKGDANATSWFGLGLVLFALIVYPLAQIAVGIDWMAVQYAGLGPTPTVILTMGVLCSAQSVFRSTHVDSRCLVEHRRCDGLASGLVVGPVIAHRRPSERILFNHPAAKCSATPQLETGTTVVCSPAPRFISKA